MRGSWGGELSGLPWPGVGDPSSPAPLDRAATAYLMGSDCGHRGQADLGNDSLFTHHFNYVESWNDFRLQFWDNETCWCLNLQLNSDPIVGHQTGLVTYIV